MQTAATQNINTHKDLSNFVHELNVFRRQVALYPLTHPKTRAGAAKVLAELAKLGKYGDCISLGITPDNLLFNGSHLDEDNPSCRDLGAFFSTLDIALVSFYQRLRAEELIDFWRLVSTGISRHRAATLDQALKEHQIVHIRLNFTDYSAFTAAAGTTAAAITTDIWKEFVQTLVPDHDGAGINANGNHAEQLAQIFNSAVDDSDYTALTSELVNRLFEQCRGSVTGIGGQLYEFSKKLKPDIRRRFHEDTLRALDHQADAAQEIILVSCLVSPLY